MYITCNYQQYFLANINFLLIMMSNTWFDADADNDWLHEVILFMMRKKLFKILNCLCIKMNKIL